MYYKEARGAFVVYDISKERTLHEGALKWKNDIDNKVFLPNGDPIPVVLLANKCDLSPSDSTEKLTEELNRFCKIHGFAKWYALQRVAES
jgi:Ras-related protein Rab-32